MRINWCMGCMQKIEQYPCPHCGYTGGPQPDFALKQGTILKGKYLVGRVLGQGGFGITYIGMDLSLEIKVAIKEYYPSGCAVRSRVTGDSLLWSGNDQSVQQRKSGIEGFMREARRMAKVDSLDGVVHVRDLFTDNETAYIVMDFAEGTTLKSMLRETGPLPWDQAKNIFLPVLETLAEIHSAGIIHRDISPDNLMISSSGKVQILDLGAAKDISANSGESSVVVAKGGFSPLEQYSQRGGSGPWTDVYAIAATMYYSITGTLPPAAIDRIDQDVMQWDFPQLRVLPLNVQYAIRKGMSIKPGDRYSTAAEMLTDILAVPPEQEAAPAPQTPTASQPSSVPQTPPAPQTPPTSEEQPPESTKTKPKNTLWIITALVCVLALAPFLANKWGFGLIAAGDFEVGDYVVLGHFEQDNNPGNGEEPLEWQILEKNGNRALLISRRVLKRMQYNTKLDEVTWENASIREWLNGEFIQNSFAGDEVRKIVKTTVSPERDSDNKADQGKDTKDRVFILSKNEVEKYFPSAADRKGSLTAYAKAQGTSGWLLRSPEGKYAVYVQENGGISAKSLFVSALHSGVRPSMWITLDSSVERLTE